MAKTSWRTLGQRGDPREPRGELGGRTQTARARGTGGRSLDVRMCVAPRGPQFSRLHICGTINYS